MVEAIFLFLAKVVTVIICAGFLVLPLYLIATLFYAIYKDCRCPNKAKSTRDKISAWFFILISSNHKASAYHPAKSLPLPAVGSMCRFERMSAQAFINPSLSSFPSGTSPLSRCDVIRFLDWWLLLSAQCWVVPWTCSSVTPPSNTYISVFFSAIVLMVFNLLFNTVLQFDL